MAHDDVKISPDTWTQLTSGDVSAIRVQSLDYYPVKIQATATSTAPTSDAGAMVLERGDVIAANLTLADLFPGVSGAARVWAKGTGRVSYSHG